MSSGQGEEPRLVTVVLASHNRGKLAELRALFAHLPVELVEVSEVVHAFTPPVEDGDTFEANAFLKARAAAEATQLVAIADDSGLEVDALGGRPGVRSARFAREGATDAENNAALLAALQEVEDPERTARFRCVMALVDPFADLDKPLYAEGRCEGLVVKSPTGESGFGYDPLFLVPTVGKTYAELDDATKNELSHRGRAARALLPQLSSLVEARLLEAKRVLGEAD